MASQTLIFRPSSELSYKGFRSISIKPTSSSKINYELMRSFNIPNHAVSNTIVANSKKLSFLLPIYSSLGNGGGESSSDYNEFVEEIINNLKKKHAEVVLEREANILPFSTISGSDITYQKQKIALFVDLLLEFFGSFRYLMARIYIGGEDKLAHLIYNSCAQRLKRNCNLLNGLHDYLHHSNGIIKADEIPRNINFQEFIVNFVDLEMTDFPEMPPKFTQILIVRHAKGRQEYFFNPITKSFVKWMSIRDICGAIEHVTACDGGTIAIPKLWFVAASQNDEDGGDVGVGRFQRLVTLRGF